MSDPNKKPYLEVEISVEISKVEHDFLKSMTADFVNLLQSLERMGDTLEPLYPKVEEKSHSGKPPSMLNQGKMVFQLLPQIQQLIPALGKELENHIRPTCLKYRSFVNLYTQNKHGSNHSSGHPK